MKKTTKMKTTKLMNEKDYQNKNNKTTNMLS